MDIPSSHHSFTKTIIVDKKCISSILKAENEIKKLKMNFEEKRIESFRNWSIPYISVFELAKNGFYYTGKSDRVRCNFCDFELYEWKAQDKPVIEHSKWVPNCSFITKKEEMNFPLETSCEESEKLCKLIEALKINKKVHFCLSSD